MFFKFQTTNKMDSKTFEQQCAYKPMSDGNLPALSTTEVAEMATGSELALVLPTRKLSDDKEFYELLLCYKDPKRGFTPLVFTFDGKIDPAVQLNKFNQKFEFVFDVSDNGHAQVVFGSVIKNYIESELKRHYGSVGGVKSPMYNNKVTMPWSASYGKYLDIEVRTRQLNFACHPDRNLKALQQLLANHTTGSAVARGVVKCWLRREKITGILSAGYKFHLQSVQLN